MIKRKIFILAIVAGLAISISGCSKKNIQSTATESPNTSGVITDIAAALKAGTTMECTFTANEGDEKTSGSAFFSGEKFKTSATTANGTFYSIFDGTTYYMWVDGQSEGTKMEKNCLEDTKTVLNQQPSQDQLQYENPQDVIDDSTDMTCKASSAADFTAPAEIEFTDLCAMLQQQMIILNQLK